MGRPEQFRSLEHRAEQDLQRPLTEKEKLGFLSARIQAYEVKGEAVVLWSRYYKDGSVTIPFHKIVEGGQFYRKLAAAGYPKGGRE